MSQLDQILTSIFSDINSAKARADMASRDIASRYVSDEILQYFPIPRVGIENLELELKYIIENVEEKVENSSQSDQRLAEFVHQFSSNTAKELRQAVTRETLSNKFYKELKGYPDQSWEDNISEMLENSLNDINLNSPNYDNSISKNFQKIRTEIKEVVPMASTIGSFVSIPTLKGTFNLISLDEKGEEEYKVLKEFQNPLEAITEAKSLLEGITKKTVKVTEAKTSGNTNIGKLISGNKQIAIEAKVDTRRAPNAKAFFDSSLAKKTLETKEVPIVNSWILGKKVTTPKSSPKTTSVKEITDESLFLVTKNLLDKKSIDFQNGIRNIFDQSKITTLNIAVDAEKISKAKPESVLTLKFNLNSKDFAMINESETPSTF